MRILGLRGGSDMSGAPVVLSIAVGVVVAAWVLFAVSMAQHTLSEPFPYSEMTRSLASFAVLFAVAYTCFYVALIVSQTGNLNFLMYALAVIGVLAFATPPARSPDLFWTLAVAKGWVLHGVHPYTATVSAIGDHSWNIRAPFITGIVYGPVWAYLTGAVATVTDSLRVAVSLMKLVGVSCFVIGVTSVATILKMREVSARKRAVLVVLLAFNPILLQAGIVDVNNDIITFAALSFAMLLCVRRSYLPSVAVLLLGGLVKYVPWLMIPVPLAWMILERQWPSRRDVFVLVSAVVLVAASYVPFGAPALYGLQMRASFAEFSQPEMAMPGGWFLYVLGLTAMQVRMVGVVLMLIVTGWCVHRRYRFAAWFCPLLVLILFGGMWVNPWYLLWILPAATVLLGGWAVWLIGVIGMLMPWAIHPLPLGMTLMGGGLTLALGAVASQRFASGLRSIIREVS